MKNNIYLIVLKSFILVLSTSIFIGCGSDDCCNGDTLDIQPKNIKKPAEPAEPVKPNPVNPAEPIKPNPVNPTGKLPNTPAVNKNISPISIINDGNGYININNCETVQFTGENSYDEDGNITAYSWTDMDNNILETQMSFDRQFCTNGIYEKTLVVTDDDNATGISRVCILVGIDKEDIPLMANAGIDQSITEGESISLSGRAICRTENLSYKWMDGDVVISTDSNFTKSDFSIGTHVLTFSVFDEDEYAHQDVTVSITVNP